MIISVSRRTDIPRYHFDWFMERVNEGFADVANPFNAAQIKRISLKPGDVKFMVFWTRDPKKILETPGLSEKYRFYVMTTLTGYPKIIEPNAPAKDDVIYTMKALAQRLGKNRVIWRYDPVFLTDLTDSAFHKRNFSELASALAGVTERVIISIYDEYSGAKRRLSAMEREGQLRVLSHSGPQVTELITELARIANDAGINIQSCAEDLTGCGVKMGACIDSALINAITGEEQDKGRDRNQRQACLCAQSVDIGVYGTCPAECVYCYARRAVNNGVTKVSGNSGPRNSGT